MVVARGSLLELETQAVIAADLEYLSIETAEHVVVRTTDVICLLNGLIRHYTKHGR